MAVNIVFFDGTCNLCNGFVDFLIARDPSFSLASLQGESAQKILPPHLREELSTVIYYKDGKFLERSRAIGEILQDLGGIYKIFGGLVKIMPSFFADGVYRFISKRRYQIFGKRGSCRLPSESEQKYFLP